MDYFYWNLLHYCLFFYHLPTPTSSHTQCFPMHYFTSFLLSLYFFFLMNFYCLLAHLSTSDILTFYSNFPNYIHFILISGCCLNSLYLLPLSELGNLNYFSGSFSIFIKATMRFLSLSLTTILLLVQSNFTNF